MPLVAILDGNKTEEDRPLGGSMKLAIAMILGLILCASAAGQTTPSLADTAAFLNTMGVPDGHFVTVDACTMRVGQVDADGFPLDGGGMLHLSGNRAQLAEFDPVKGYLWYAWNPEPLAAEFKLSDIDTTHIGSFGVVTVDIFLDKKLPELPKEPSLDEDPNLFATHIKEYRAALKVYHEAHHQFNSWAVVIDTKDRVKAIKETYVDAHNPNPQTPQYCNSSGTHFFFSSKDRAERFVTGLKHAAELCGGGPSLFPPTPAK